MMNEDLSEECLKRIFYYGRMQREAYSKLKDRIDDFECDFIQNDYSIITAKKWLFKGLIVVETFKYSLDEWFNDYNDIFVSKFGLKVVKIIRINTLYKYNHFKIYYTFKENPDFEELSDEEISKFIMEWK